MNTIINSVNKIITDIKPFKTAIFTVFIAVMASFSVSVISSLGKQIITDEMYTMGLDGMTASAYTSDGNNATDIVFYNTLSGMYEISDISPVICSTTTATFSNGIFVETMGWGIDYSAAEIISLNIMNGRMINDVDIEGSSRVCLIDKNLAEKIYKRDNINGKTVALTIGGKTELFKIIGTNEKESNILNALTGEVIPDFIYIPYTTMHRLSSKNAFDQIIFRSSDTTQSASEFKQKVVNENYRYRNHTIKLTNLSGQKEQILKISDTAFLSLFAVSCVAVVVCSMAVGSSVNTAVISRQKDIGIKISMGASRWNITTEFLSAALISCLIGIFYAGVLIFVLMKIVTQIFGIYFIADYSLIVFSVFATIVLTVIFSFSPSYNAAKMSPIKALNRE